MGFSINDILVQSVKDKIWVGNYVYFMDTLFISLSLLNTTS